MRTTLWGSWFWCMLPAFLLTIGLAVVALRLNWEANQQVAASLQRATGLAETRLQHEAMAAEDYVVSAREMQIADLKRRLKEQVDLAYSVMAAVYQQAKGQMPDAALATLVRESLRSARFFQGRGYYFIDTLDGTAVLLPLKPSLETLSLRDKRDDSGLYPTREIVRIAEVSPHAGYVYYRWPSIADPTGWADKLSYVRLFEPLNWVVGAGDYLPELNNFLFDSVAGRIRTIHFASSGGVGLLSVDGSHDVLAELPAGGDHTDNPEAVPSIIDKPDDRAVAALASLLIDKGRAGGGIVRYDWIVPNSRQTERRVAWVQPILNNGVVLYASMQVADIENAAETPASLSPFLPVIIGVIFLALMTQGIAVWRTVVVPRRRGLE